MTSVSSQWAYFSVSRTLCLLNLWSVSNLSLGAGCQLYHRHTDTHSLRFIFDPPVKIIVYQGSATIIIFVSTKKLLSWRWLNSAAEHCVLKHHEFSQTFWQKLMLHIVKKKITKYYTIKKKDRTASEVSSPASHHHQDGWLKQSTIFCQAFFPSMKLYYL